MKKSIKRISSLALSLLMMASTMPMAFATDNVITEDDMTNNVGSGEVDVTVTLAERYTFTFPGSITFRSSTLENSGTTTFAVDYTDLRLESDTTIAMELYFGERNLTYPECGRCYLNGDQNTDKYIPIMISTNRTANITQANAGQSNVATLALDTVSEGASDDLLKKDTPAGAYSGTLNVCFTYSKSNS